MDRLAAKISSSSLAPVAESNVALLVIVPGGSSFFIFLAASWNTLDLGRLTSPIDELVTILFTPRNPLAI